MYQDSDDKVSIFSVGDISLGDSPKMLGVGVRESTVRKGSNFLFVAIENLPPSDLVFGNLEGVLSEASYKKNSFKYGQLCGLPSMASALKQAGFNVLNVANNHMMQYGSEAFLETLASLESLGIGCVGVKGENGWFCRPLKLEIKGKRIGILGYADPDNYGFEPLFALLDTDEILADIKRLSKDVDLLIVSLHWGDEFIRCPSQKQREIAYKLLDNGCDLILGHHPHVIQNIEKRGNGWVCYSLGNFISDMVWNPRTIEGLAPIFTFSNSGLDLDRIQLVAISSDFVPSLTDSSLSDIEKITSCDSFVDDDLIRYKHHVYSLCKKNKYLSHFYLLQTFYHYSMKGYFEIWKNSIWSLFNK